MEYGDLFASVRQRVAAFKYYLEFNDCKNYFNSETEDDYIDNAYRFLYTTVIDINNDKFLKFCAKKEKMSYKDYTKMLLGDW